MEWLNGIGKNSDGIIGIKRKSIALNRLALSYNMRSDIANEARSMYNIVLAYSLVHNETPLGKRNHDNQIITSMKTKCI